MNEQEFKTLAPHPSVRVPPHSVEVEQYLLSCCLLDGGESLSMCLEEKLCPESFYIPAHAILFRAMVGLFADDKPPSIEAVIEELRKSRMLESIGGIPFVMEIAARVPSNTQTKYFIEKVREFYVLRELIKISDATKEKCYETQEDVGELVESVTSDILAVHDHRPAGVSWQDAIHTAKVETEQLANSTKPLVNELTWGFSDLDRFFGRPQTGQLVVIGARPSIGKSSLARQIAIANADAGDDVAFMTIEVKSKRVALSMAQTYSQVSYKDIQQRRCRRDDVDLFLRGLDKISELKGLHIFEDTNITAAIIASKVKALKSRFPGLKAVIIDQLNLMDDAVAAHGMKLPEAIARVTRSLKKMSASEDVCTFLLSQLNRSSARENIEPALHDLRDSGMIESDADKVVLLHRPPEDPTQTPPQKQDDASRVEECPTFYVNAIQAKGRDDGTARVGLRFVRNIATFRQILRQNP